MGCDIHCHAEVKLNGKWHHLRDIEIQRDYRLFGIMVRHLRGDKNIEPLSEEKGLPDDISELTKHLLAESQAGHTFSYLNKDKLELLYEYMRENNYRGSHKEDFPCLLFYYLSNDRFIHFDNGFNSESSSEFEDYRLVFGFDN